MATTIGQIQAVNPATGEVIASFDAFGADEVGMALADAHDAFLEWRDRPITERAVPMRALASLLRERADRYARLATLEMGKPINEAKAEIEKCAFGAEHFALNASRYLADLRALQPAGPYFLGGYCFGGYLAYEMACSGRRVQSPMAANCSSMARSH